MYNYQIETLIVKIKEADKKTVEKREAFNTLKAALDQCVLYMRTAIVTLVQTYVTTWDKSTHEDENLLKVFQGYRHNAHVRCIQACKEINALCDEYGVERIISCDTDASEHEMDKAVGALVCLLHNIINESCKLN